MYIDRYIDLSEILYGDPILFGLFYGDHIMETYYLLLRLHYGDLILET